MYNFIKFENRNARQESRITITKSHSFGFPTKFSSDNGIKKFKYVILFYDKDSESIGIQFTNDETDSNKFSIIKYEKYGASVVARSFFKTNNINLEKHHGKYKWKIVKIENIGKLFVIELDNRDLKNK